MKNNILFCFFIFVLTSANINAQSETYAKFYNKGNKLSEKNFEEAEKNFRVAIDDTLGDLRATFNLSNKYYNEGLYDEAISRQLEASELAKTKSEKHKAFHNLGNSLMKKEMCSEAVMAFKNALRNNPGDDETRYNLALAKKCEEDQQNEDQNKDDENKDDQNENKEDQQNEDQNKDDENKDDQNENKEDQQNEDQNKDDENKDDQNENKQDQNDNQNKDDNKSDKPKENKNQQSKLSPQQIKNLLKAMENAEKKVQAKVNDKKQKGTKVVSEKDW